MILPAVNGLAYAHREDAVDHARYQQWLEETIQSGQPYAISDPVLSGFLRVVTDSRVFTTSSPIRLALDFARQVREQANCQVIAPGSRHWHIFTSLGQSISATGNLVPDVWFAALAIESGCEWVTTDRDYQRFPGLRWRHSLTGDASK